MKLNLVDLEQLKEVLDQGPSYDVEAVREETKKHPQWFAFGIGNIFRAFIARINQDLLNAGQMKTGMIAAETFSDQNVTKLMQPFDNLAISVTLDKKGAFSTDLIANLAEALFSGKDYARLAEIFRNPSLQVASFTITEKGYSVTDASGALSGAVKAEIAGDPNQAKNTMVVATFLMKERYQAGATPLTLLSLDNHSHNGTVLRNAVLAVAEEMVAQGKAGKDFLEWLSDTAKVSFPWTMIDKITPASSEEVAKHLVRDFGIENAGRIDLGRGRFAAPFVNAEEKEYLVIEDDFVNGRPPFEKAGVYMGDRETVMNVENMKLTAALNPLHTTMAIYGSLLEEPTIYDCVQNPLIKDLIEKLCYQELLPMVKDPVILDPKQFAHEVIEDRFANPYIPDQPARIATDTSQKMAIRLGTALKKYQAQGRAAELEEIPLVFAGWIRYLLGKTDHGAELTISPDPLLPMLQTALQGIAWDHFERTEGLENLLRDAKLFGADLYEAGLAERVLSNLELLCRGEGAVEKTLAEHRK
ncbi:MAG: mannitol dehydrogenase family protein [Peptoniphilaceae bacterium]|nr:mannitol dehydrogenase family protein [Peptoniphilaceae bacterium]